jgi:hypothetical protein
VAGVIAEKSDGRNIDGKDDVWKRGIVLSL